MLKNLDYFDPQITRKETRLYFANGATAYLVDDKYKFIMYNTGDKIWLNYENGEYIVVTILSHDGVITNY